MILLKIADFCFLWRAKLKEKYEFLKYRLLNNNVLFYKLYQINNDKLCLKEYYNCDNWYNIIFIIVGELFHIGYSKIKKIERLNILRNEIVISHFVKNGQLKKFIFDIDGYNNLLGNIDFSGNRHFCYVNLNEINSKVLNIDITNNFDHYNSSFYLPNKISCKDWINICKTHKLDKNISICRINSCKVDIIRDTDLTIQTFKENDIIFFNNE